MLSGQLDHIKEKQRREKPTAFKDTLKSCRLSLRAVMLQRALEDTNFSTCYVQPDFLVNWGISNEALSTCT